MAASRSSLWGPDHRPFVSVVMPVRDEAAFISESLGAVLAQDYPGHRLEILVVDGASTDRTVEVVREMARQVEDVEVRVLRNERGIVPVSLNMGIAEARGEIIVRVDGHCVVEPDYVRRCVALLGSTGASCVGGSTRTVGEGWVARAIAIAQSSRFGVGGVAFRTETERAGPVDTVPFGAYPRDVFERHGIFDEELVRDQDDDFNYRLNRAGEVVWIDPSVRSTYHSRSSFKGLARQYFGYGVYKVRVLQKSGLRSIRHLVPTAFVGALVASGALSSWTRRPLAVSFVLGPYLAANLFASLAAGRRDPSTIPLLPAAFSTMHVSYGLGFLAGLWRWRHRFGSTGRA